MNATALYTGLLTLIASGTDSEFEEVFGDMRELAPYLAMLTPTQRQTVLVKKNVRKFGGINPYVEDFLPKTIAYIEALPAGEEKETTKRGQRALIETMLGEEGLTDENRTKLHSALGNQLAAAAAGGGRWKMPRKYSRRYCKQTPCRKMGFTQRSSCRPYKNCFTRKARKSTRQ